MSAAIMAKTAKERANIAIRIMRQYAYPFSRELDNCFEMGDGDTVLSIILDRAAKDVALAQLVNKTFGRGSLARIGK